MSTPKRHEIPDALDLLAQAITALETAQDRHATACEAADELEARMPDEKDAAIQRLMALDGRSSNQADKTVGTDPEYAALRQRRAILARDKQRGEYAVLTASRRVTLAEERAKLARVREAAAADQLAMPTFADRFAAALGSAMTKAARSAPGGF
jgi:hypothetical protein